MGNIRTTIGGIGGTKFPSKTPGDATGFGLNTFGLKKLQEGVTGEALSNILEEALESTREYAVADWPRITGASGDTIRIEKGEIGPKMARVNLVVGGAPLIEDPRNKSHKDYAPFVEFNGTSKTPPGTITHAMFANEAQMKESIRESVRELIEGLLR